MVNFSSFCWIAAKHLKVAFPTIISSRKMQVLRWRSTANFSPYNRLCDDPELFKHRIHDKRTKDEFKYFLIMNTTKRLVLRIKSSYCKPSLKMIMDASLSKLFHNCFVKQITHPQSSKGLLIIWIDNNLQFFDPFVPLSRQFIYLSLHCQYLYKTTTKIL